MSHLAYRCFPIYENHPPKITCLEAWGKLLIVGTEKGHLLVYEIVGRDDPKKPFTVNLKLSLKEFSKKPIDQIAVVQPDNLFISLSEGNVMVHSLPSFSKVCQVAPKLLKGVHMFAVDQDRKNGLRLAVGMKKRLITFEWANNDFQLKKELAIPDNVRTCVWADQSLCIGFKREYNMIDTNNGGMNELFVTGKSEPIAIPIPDQQIMLGRDNITVTVGYDRRPTRKFGLSWTDAPKALAQSHPFIVAVLQKTVEIQFVFGSLSQTLPLSGVEYVTVASDGSVYLANKIPDGTIWRLVPVPFLEQIEGLEKKKRYSEALSLTELLPASVVTNRDERIANLTLLNAYAEFNAGKHGPAMSTLFQLKVDPLQVVALCGGLLPPPLRAKYVFPVQIEEMKGPALTSALQALSSYLELKRKDLRLSERLLQMQQAYLNKVAGVVTDVTYGHTIGGVGDIDIGSFQQVDWNETTSLAQIIDTSLLKCYVMTRPELISNLLKLPNHCHVKESEKVLLNHAKFSELVLLYKGREMHRQALELLFKLGSAPNSPLPGVMPTVTYLKDLGAKNFDLILEFCTWCLNADPTAALEIFTAIRAPADTLPAQKVLAHLENLAQPSDPAGPNPKRQPLSTAFVVRYLEFVINDLQDETKELHNKLAYYYFDLVRELKKTADPSLAKVTAGTEPGLLGKMRSKLIDFLEESKFYVPAQMLSKYNFAEEGLHEERAILLSKIGYHYEALREYVHKMRDFTQAELYCKYFTPLPLHQHVTLLEASQHYNQENEENRNVYLALLKVFMLEPSSLDDAPRASELKTAAARLLDKYYREIDTVKALEILSDSTPVAELFPYFEKVFRDLNSNHRNLAVTSSLQKSESMRIKAELLKNRANVVRITDDSICPVCGKRLGDAIFARYPSGVVIHWLCFKQQPDKSIDPITGERYVLQSSTAI